MSPESSLANGLGSSPPARYPGEDTRPTSSRELNGWYTYAFAAEVYTICGISSFIPILLESLARENGVLLSDRTTPCPDSSERSKNEADQCIIYVLDIPLNTASFAMYTFSISVLVQALLVVSISCAADHGNFRKKLLLSFAWIGSFSVMAYILVTTSTYLLGALLTIVSNVAFGASFVLLNAFLPLLVRHHPKPRYAEVAVFAEEADSPERDATAAGHDDEVEADRIASTALLRGEPMSGNRLICVPTNEQVTSIELSLSTQISAKGVGIGYMAGLFLQCVSILVLVALARERSSTWPLRVVLFVVGAWWAVFTIPVALLLRPRPGPPLHATSELTWFRAWASYTVYAWKSLFKTAQLTRRLVDVVLFLSAWFLLSDAIATTSTTAILFAKTSLHMEAWALGMVNVISTTAGVAGAFSWSWLSCHFGLRPHQTILACLFLFELIPLYGLLGYLPIVQRWGVGGLQQPWEMYPLAAVYGIVMGGLSGYCRSLFGELIPPGSEAAFYALYAITDKGSSVFGPAIVGAITEAAGEIRPAFWFLAALVGLPVPFLWFVDVERGKRQGAKLVEAIDGLEAEYHGVCAEQDGSVAEDLENFHSFPQI